MEGPAPPAASSYLRFGVLGIPYVPCQRDQWGPFLVLTRERWEHSAGSTSASCAALPPVSWIDALSGRRALTVAAPRALPHRPGRARAGRPAARTCARRARVSPTRRSCRLPGRCIGRRVGYCTRRDRAAIRLRTSGRLACIVGDGDGLEHLRSSRRLARWARRSARARRPRHVSDYLAAHVAPLQSGRRGLFVFATLSKLSEYLAVVLESHRRGEPAVPFMT